MFGINFFITFISILNLDIAASCRRSGSNDCCANFMKTQGECVACPPGCWGENCSERCPSGYYGTDCKHICKCSANEICSIEFGCQKCSLGYQGFLNYTLPCVDGFYGQECNEICNCSANAKCHSTVGCHLWYTVNPKDTTYLGKSSPLSTVTPEQEQIVYVADSLHIILLSLVGMANLLIIFIMVECIVLFKQYQKQKTFEKNKENYVHLSEPMSRDGDSPDNYMEEDAV